MTDLLIVDDHEIVRAGIRRLVENTPNLNIVADLGSGEEAYQFLQKNIARGGSDFQSRAESVADYLVQNGLDPDRVTAIGLGETKPIADNNTRLGKQQNRRVEFHLARK